MDCRRDANRCELNNEENVETALSSVVLLCVGGSVGESSTTLAPRYRQNEGPALQLEQSVPEAKTADTTNSAGSDALNNARDLS